MQTNNLNLSDIPKGTITKMWLHLVNNGIGEPVRIPILIAKGEEDGPVLGITAAIHGNELNGVRVIQKLFKKIKTKKLKGTVIGVLIANVPGLLAEQRRFIDDHDLNRISPGKPDGNRSEVYINRLITRIISKFEYLIDLHTASFGRANSFYVRADMNDPVAAKMAIMQNADLILNNTANDKSLRGTAEEMGIHAITVELKDPHKFQKSVIDEEILGIKNVMAHLKMINSEVICSENGIYICQKSHWIYTDEGGILTVLPPILSAVRKGDKIAEVRNIFGDIVKDFFATQDGIVIGKSTNPINQTGSRIIHLGTDYKSIYCDF